MKKLISIILLISQISIAADCPKPVIRLEEGQPAVCRGYLFSPAKELEIYKINEDYKLLKQENEIKDQQIVKYKQQVIDLGLAVDNAQQKSQLWQIRAEDSTNKLIQIDENRSRRDLLFLVGGAILVILSGWALGQVKN